MDRILFADREEAGRRLAELYDGPREDVVVLGIARGGVPVGYPVADTLGGTLDVVTARKLPIPWNPEMGFGAIAPDGTAVLNEELLPRLRMSQAEVDAIASRVLSEVRRREDVFRGARAAAGIEGKNVILTDDGLATGFTMTAAIEMAKKQGAASITVAVPVSPTDTARRIEALVDRLICIHTARGLSFAVAGFYADFHDLDDREVLYYLEKARKR